MNDLHKSIVSPYFFQEISRDFDISGIVKKFKNENKINDTDSDFGQTALHLAVAFKRDDFTVSLLENGIDVDIKDNQGRTARDIARIIGNESFLSRYVETVPDVCNGKFKSVKGGRLPKNILVKESYEHKFITYDVPGDGSCFYHAVSNGFVGSTRIWKKVVDNSGGSLCTFVTKWWKDYKEYLLSNGELVESLNLEKYFNQEFFRHIISKSITEDDIQLYMNTTVNGLTLSPSDARKKMMDKIRDCGEWADNLNISILNRALHPYLRVVTFIDLNGSERGPDDVLSFLFVSVVDNHYNLLKVGESDDFIVKRENIPGSIEGLLFKR